MLLTSTSTHARGKMKKLFALAAMAVFMVACSKKEEPPKPLPKITVSETDDVAVIKAAADKGDPEAQMLYSIELRSGRRTMINEKEAFIYREKAANAGHTVAQSSLAGLLISGTGVLPDLDRAAELEKNAYPALEKLANSGDVRAMEHLGVFLIDRGSKEIPKDEKRGFALLSKAAESGDKFALWTLGRYFATKSREWYDPDKAITTLTLAFEKGEARTALQLYGIYRYEKKDENAATEWLTKGWEKGCVECANYLANLSREAKDEAKYREWLNKAAERGESFAQYRLGRLYIFGEDITLRNDTLGVEWITKAANQEDAFAKGELGRLYVRGEHVAKDEKKGFDLVKWAARAGSEFSAIELGRMCASGIGTEIDTVLAYAWANLASTSSGKSTSDLARKNRDIYEKSLNREEREEAQRLTSNWKLGRDIVRDKPTTSAANPSPGDSTKSKPGELTKVRTGTAFTVSEKGHVLTVAHVIDESCKEIRIAGSAAKATFTTSDKVNDLALIKVESDFKSVAGIAAEPAKIRQGEDIVVYGYPLNFVLSSGGNLTPGVVSALTGLGNNSNQIQITAPIQPGSSGSPVVDKKGRVIGMVSMKLSDSKTAAAVGSLPQNVNFAINAQTIRTFLETHQVPFKSSGSFLAFDKSSADLSDEAKKWTSSVECWK